MRITTIEGKRSVTKGSSTIKQYNTKRRSLLSKSTMVGRSRHSIRWWEWLFKGK